MAKILISSCLFGHKVRYDGRDCLQSHPRLKARMEAGGVLSICPEVAGGLSIPRPPAQIQGVDSGLGVLEGRSRVVTDTQQDVTDEFVTGAHRALELAKAHNVQVAILKARSPSCGSRQVYDGTFSKAKAMVDGMGVTAALLNRHGIQVFDESQIDEALDAAGPLES